LVTTRARAGWEGPAAIPHAAVAQARIKREAAEVQSERLVGNALWWRHPDGRELDQGPLRWLAPTRDLAAPSRWLTNNDDSGARTTKTVMTGAALRRAATAHSTGEHVQPGGFVVSRYTYIRARNANTARTTRSISTRLVSAATGKVFRASVPKLPAFR